jgi:hypothetical protein
MIPLAVLLTSIPPGSRDLLEFGFFVTVGMTAAMFFQTSFLLIIFGVIIYVPRLILQKYTRWYS